jgi:enoyl-CoA hydratase/carnithine racemase
MNEKDAFNVELDGYIAWLTLNRPDQQNVMGFAFFEGLTKYFAQFDDDSNVHGVVIKAEGKSFTAGLDLVEFGSLLGGGIGVDARGSCERRSSSARRV